METQITQLGNVERALMTNDLSALTIEERAGYYKQVCASLGLNPLTQPFGYIEMGDGNQKKLTLYCKADAAAQLRKIHSLSLRITKREVIGELLMVTAEATTLDGRTDESIAAIWLNKNETVWDNLNKKYKRTGNIVPIEGEALANLYMKAETKAKRRVTLSICGLAWLDETDVEEIKKNEKEVQVNGEMLLPEKVKSTVKKEPLKIEEQAGPFKYDLASLPEEKKQAAFEYLTTNGATMDEASGIWEHPKMLKKLVACIIK